MVKLYGLLSIVAAATNTVDALPATLVKEARHSAKTNPVLYERALKQRRSVQEKIAMLARPARKLNNNGNQQGYNYGNNNQNQQAYNYGNNNQYQQGYNYGNQVNNNANQGGGNYYYGNSNAASQSQEDWADWENEWNWDINMAEEDYGFDISNYAIKFTQCATIASYSDDLAGDEYSDTVLAAQRFAIFRLCPAQQCSSFSNNGCNTHYGEYMVSMDQYLAALMEEEEERVIGYCQYCQNCANIESAKEFFQHVDFTRQAVLAAAEQKYETWLETMRQQANQQQNGNQYMNGNMYNNYNNANYGGASNMYGNVDEMDEVELAQSYYTYVRNKSNYANDYYKTNYNGNVNGYYQNSNAVSKKSWTNSEFWMFAEGMNRQQQNENAWTSMGGSYGNFFGKPVLNGYFNQNGEFVRGWGFFNSFGKYVFLEDEQTVLEWDEGLYGELPFGWEELTIDTESCNPNYAASCYNQYEACMVILGNADNWGRDFWANNHFSEGSYHYNKDANQAYMSQYQGQQNQYQGQYQYQGQQNQYQQGAQGAEWEDNSQSRGSLKGFMTCTEWEAKNMNNDYANQAYYAKQYEQKQQYFSKQFNCYEGDEDCQNAREYALMKYEYELKKEQNRRFFIGPHCSSNGRKITLAVYKDEFCSVIDEKTSVEDLVGYNPIQELDLVPDECIACGINRDMVESMKWYEDEQVDYDIQPMCSMLYQLSGKCNKNLPSYSSTNSNSNEEVDWEQAFLSQQQAANEEAVCSFIEALKSNTYDENGEVMLTNSNAWSHPSKWSSEFQTESRYLTPGMKAAIALMSIAVAVMGVWACFLHGTLARKNIPWRPRRKLGEDPTVIARQNSGIVMGRSRSGPAQVPLI